MTEIGDTHEPVWVDRDDLLSAMGLVAALEARHGLSPGGREVFEMMSLADHKGIDPIEIYMEAEALNSLNEDDQTAIEVYFARITLVNEFKSYEG